MKILFVDIEISPTLATVWGLFNQNIPIGNIVGNSEVLSWAASWYKSDEVEFSSLGMTTKKKMLKEIYDLIEEADVVVTYNGDRFDLKILNMEFMAQGWAPPTPYKSLDLLKTMRARFRGTSNKMDYWLKYLGLGHKVEHRGYQLWLDCMNKVPGAYEEMETYNIGDVVMLEALYKRVLPWIKSHPNRSVFDDNLICPTCGGTHFQRRGIHVTAAGKYQRYQCQDCGTWFKHNKNIGIKEKYTGV